MDSRGFRLELAGPLPASLVEEIKRRFARVDPVADRSGTRVLYAEVDQAALRSLLGLIWDVGAEVRSVCRATHNGGVGSEERSES